MALFGEFDPTVDPTDLGWFDSSLVPSEWFDPTCGPVVVSILTSRSLVGIFDAKQAVACLFDECATASRWFDPITGPDDFPTLTALGLSIFAASPYAGSPFYNFGSAGTSTTRALVFRSAIPAPTVGATVNGRASAYYDSSATGAFNPLTIAGCAIWYDLAHNTNSGGVVTALPDQSGNARDATISAGHEPGFTASSAPYNNLPIMSFATVEWATTPTTGITTGARTFVLVCDIGTAATCFAVCDDAFGIWVQGNGTDIGAAGDNANIIHGGVLSTPSVVIFIDNGASSKLYINALTPVATGLDGGPQDLTGRVFTLGNCGFNLIAANSQVGSTAQFLLYDSALSSTDVATILNGFGAKYGITIGP